MQTNNSKVAEDVYYKKFWNSSGWSSKALNPDEQLRAKAISLAIGAVAPEVASQSDKGIRALDLGCGRGIFTDMMSKMREISSVLGIDPTPSSITRARELYSNLNFEILASYELLEKRGPSSFELVLSSEVLEHVEDSYKESFIKDAFSLLVPGGYAILTTPRKELWDPWLKINDEVQPTEHWITEDSLQKMAQSIGFQVINHDRIFVPGVRLNLSCKILSTSLVRHLPEFNYLKKLRSKYSIYQIIILKKPQVNN